jgi:TolB protein
MQPKQLFSAAPVSALAVLCLLIFNGLAATAHAQKGTRIAFARESEIWVSDLQGGSSKKIANGMDPCISPSGEKVAFTFLGKGSQRYIAVADIAPGTKRLLKDVPSDNCFGPVWSPDGQSIVFKIFIDNAWRFGLINADGTGFRFLETSGKSDLWSPCWTADGRSIYCQDLSTIYRISREGKALSSWDVAKIIPNGSMSSSSQMSLSPDGQRLVIEADMDEDVTIKDWEGPPPAIWIFNLQTETASRLTPSKMLATSPCWLNSNDILFDAPSANGKTTSIYRTGISLFKPVVFIKNGENPSVAFGPSH